jgi:hypothetical protein
MTDTLALIDNGGKAVQLYQKMQAAIFECHSLDDCKAIADHANPSHDRGRGPAWKARAPDESNPGGMDKKEGPPW